MHVDHLTIDQNKVLSISGAVTILCEDGLELRNSARIELLPGATLNLYVRGSAVLKNNTAINANTADPDRCQLLMLDGSMVDCQNGTEMYASVVAPQSLLFVQNGAQVCGSFVLGSLSLRNDGSGIHLDAPACTTVADVPGAAGIFSQGGITSDATFSQWFTDTAGVNRRPPRVRLQPPVRDVGGCRPQGPGRGPWPGRPR